MDLPPDFGIPGLPSIGINAAWSAPKNVVKAARPSPPYKQGQHKSRPSDRTKSGNKPKPKSKINVPPPPINGRSAIIITGGGFIKRISMQEFKTQSRGGKGKAGVKVPGDENTVTHFFSCNDYDSLIIATNKGYAYGCKAYQIPVCSRISKGKAIHQVVPIPGDSTITSVIAIDSFSADEEQLVLLTSFGYLKKTLLKPFENMSGHGLIIISLEDGDYLKWVRRCMPNEEIVIATRDGYASRISAADINSTSRKSRGVRALSLREGDALTDIDVLRNPPGTDPTLPVREPYLLAVTGMGYGKRIAIKDIHTTKRGCKGVMLIKFKSKSKMAGKKESAAPSASSSSSSSSASSSSVAAATTVTGAAEPVGAEALAVGSVAVVAVEPAAVVAPPEAAAGAPSGAAAEEGEQDDSSADWLSCIRCCESGDEVVLVTRKGTIMRQRIDDISVQSRSASGVLLQSSAKEDPIKLIDVVAPNSDLDAVPVDFSAMMYAGEVGSLTDELPVL